MQLGIALGAALLQACGRSDPGPATPALAPPNLPPTSGGIVVEPTATPFTQISLLRFSAADVRDPDGDPVELSWSFGDGARAEGPSVSHTYTAPGRFEVRLGITDGAHELALTREVVVRDMAGTWRGHAPEEYFMWLRHLPDGRITGRYLDDYVKEYMGVSGRCTAPRTFEGETVDADGYTLRFIGMIDASGDAVTGTRERTNGVRSTTVPFRMSR
jgi:hypothetical protein